MVPLPPYYFEVVLVNGVVSLVIVVMNRWGVLQVLFVSFNKSPGGFPYVFIITCEVPTLIPVYGITWETMGSLSLGETRRFLMVHPPLSESGSHTFHRSLWYFHKDLVCKVWLCDPYSNFSGGSRGTVGTLVTNPSMASLRAC